MFDVSPTIISQYANSSILTGVINSMNAAIDPTANMQTFSGYVWHLATAQGFGLDTWGEILGVSRYLELPDTGEFFGFTESGNDWAPFGQAPFYAGGATSTTFALADSAYRTLLIAKALANVSGCSIQTLNTLAQTVFGSGAMCVLDLGNMAMAYVFATTPSSVDEAIALNGSVLPRPTGVSISIRTALLFNAVMVAGNSGTQYGFGSGFGSLAPSTDLNGRPISGIYYDSSGPSFTLAIDNATALPSDYFNTLTIGGKSMEQSAATPGFSTGVNTWTWSSGVIAIANGSTDSVLIS